MFNSWKIYLKKKIDATTEQVRIESKLHKFFISNPDVDHYLSDETRKKNNANFLVGIMFGAVLSIATALIIISYWVGMGYLHIPGLRW